MRNIMKKAHEIAKEIRSFCDSYRTALSLGLREAWKMTTTSIREKLEGIGGKYWEKGELKRIYFNDLREIYGGIEVSFYKTGNVSTARLDGEKTSNSYMRGLLWDLRHGKLYYDLTDNKFYDKNLSNHVDRLVDNVKKLAGI